MRVNLRSSFLAAIAIGTGVIVLLGYFIDVPFLINPRMTLLRWAVILAGVALLVGLVNLARVHWRKVFSGQQNRFYSAILLISMALTLIIVGILGPSHDLSLKLYNYIIIPIESSLVAILAVVLVYAVARLLGQRINLFSVIFVGTVIFSLVGIVSIPGIEIPGLRELHAWVIQVWAAAGARGVLLGVALGTVATGLRILMGADRPYSG